MSSTLPPPVVLVSGVDPTAMTATVLALQWDLPGAVVVRHSIDPERQLLERTVSDLSGVIEHVCVHLDHACTTCAVREDVVPTIVRLSRDGSWGSVLVHLPVGAEADQVCHVLAADPFLQDVQVTSVVAALNGPSIEHDLLGDDLLDERGLATSLADRRGVGETAGRMVEYADLVVLTRDPVPAGTHLVRALARPSARVVVGPEMVPPQLASAHLHRHAETRDWIDPHRRAALPDHHSPHVWRAELVSERPFHPERLLSGLHRLGSGRHRSRGCFWLATRPARSAVWDGAGGQVSIGAGRSIDVGRPPLTRLVLTGTGTEPAHLTEAFEELLVRPGERFDVGVEDGFEPWLGPLPG